MLLVVALSLSLTAGAAPPAKATAAATSKADAAKAKELFKWAQKLYKQARYAEAIAKFEETYALKPHPVIYFNIGRCHEQLGDVGKAMRAYKDYLRLLPDASDRETVSDAIANLERRLKEQGMQQLMVYADPPTASIEVDGAVLGTSPASIELKAGNHKLVVSAEGFEKVERAFVMQTSRSSEMTINLRPVAKESPPMAVVPFPEPPPPPPLDVPKKEEPKKLEPTVAAVTPPAGVVKSGPQKASGGRVWTWVAGGAAVVGVGVGVALGMGASASAAKLKDPEDSALRTRAQSDALVNATNASALGANVSYGVAVTAAIAAGVLFFVEGGSSSPSTAPSSSATGKAFAIHF